MDKPISHERRLTPRFSAKCDMEVVASLTLLDTDAELPVGEIVFLGETKDISARGLGLVLPSTTIDERYCSESSRLNLSLHLPDATVNLEVNPIRCEPLDERDLGRGYFLGARIIAVSRHKEEFDGYLATLSKPTKEN